MATAEAKAAAKAVREDIAIGKRNGGLPVTGRYVVRARGSVVDVACEGYQPVEAPLVTWDAEIVRADLATLVALHGPFVGRVTATPAVEVAA